MRFLSLLLCHLCLQGKWVVLMLPGGEEEDLGSVTIQENMSGKGCSKKLRSSDLAVL